MTTDLNVENELRGLYSVAREQLHMTMGSDTASLLKEAHQLLVNIDRIQKSKETVTQASTPEMTPGRILWRWSARLLRRK